MRPKRLDHQTDPATLRHWYLLSMVGGAINAGGFLATERFVSHVTGFATLFGVDLAIGKVEAALGILSVPIFFLMGAFIAGLLIDREVQHGRRAHYGLVIGLSAVLLAAAGFLGGLEHFGDFRNEIRLKQVYLLLALLCMASGLQNAAVSSASGRTLRTTHLTGLTTDIGLAMARLLSLKALGEPGRNQELQMLWRRASGIGVFVAGSLIGAALFVWIEYRGFWVLAALTAVLGYLGRSISVPSSR